jgi:DNA-binding response OmpR family regulator
MKTIRVLLADDEEEFVTALVERMAIRGIPVDGVTTCDAAFDLAKQNKYDVAVLDVKLPGMSGFELKKKIARIAPQTKFIFITGHGSYSSFKQGTCEAGCPYYLLKPVDIEVLVERINEITGADIKNNKDASNDQYNERNRH